MALTEERGPDGRTDAERQAAWLAEEARFEASFASRKAAGYHTRCRDCGVFVKKSRWVKKDSHDAIQRQHRPLCSPCWSEYDHEY
ncbi:hypothetical protein EQ826_01685 [Ectopseudomonas mendocina]|nr:hypothetical protein [Pseudomonas mendocina]TRO29614.1 hypothetical protein EQ826_01685 [Pseudomonas mendocina]